MKLITTPEIDPTTDTGSVSGRLRAAHGCHLAGQAAAGYGVPAGVGQINLSPFRLVRFQVFHIWRKGR
jgi:hypothetical protein